MKTERVYVFSEDTMKQMDNWINQSELRGGVVRAFDTFLRSAVVENREVIEAGPDTAAPAPAPAPDPAPAQDEAVESAT